MTETLMDLMPHLSSSEALGMAIMVVLIALWAVAELWLELGSPLMAKLCDVLFAVADCSEDETEETPPA